MKKIIVIISLMTLVFAQAEWNGLSVANSDDLNALSANPAGLGIHRIYQSGFFIENDDFFKFDENTLYKSIDRYDGFAYALTYKESDKLFNPTDFTIGFGKKILDNAYFGLNWKNNNTVNLGFLYRPFNFLSLGATSMFDDDFTELELGERFLFGENVIEQKIQDNLTIVTYFTMVGKNGKNVLYTTNIERLKKEEEI